jgi:hypothetical protein
MNDRPSHLDLLADRFVTKMDALCGEAVRRALEEEVFGICGIVPNASDEDGRERYEWAKHLYAKGLLDDVLSHIANRWAGFRETEHRLHSAASLALDDEGDFEP